MSYETDSTCDGTLERFAAIMASQIKTVEDYKMVLDGLSKEEDHQYAMAMRDYIQSNVDEEIKMKYNAELTYNMTAPLREKKANIFTRLFKRGKNK